MGIIVTATWSVCYRVCVGIIVTATWSVCYRVCVGIKVEPAETDNWYCPRCKLKQKKKKQRRKKSK